MDQTTPVYFYIEIHASCKHASCWHVDTHTHIRTCGSSCSISGLPQTQHGLALIFHLRNADIKKHRRLRQAYVSSEQDHLMIDNTKQETLFERRQKS